MGHPVGINYAGGLLNINARSSILTDLFDLNNDDTKFFKHNYLKMDFGFVTTIVFVNSGTRLKLQGAKNLKKVSQILYSRR